jgi:hypothetical protein
VIRGDSNITSRTIPTSCTTMIKNDYCVSDMIISFYFSIMMIMLISLLAQFEFFVVVAKVSMNFSVNDYRLQEKKLFRGFAEYLCFRKF